MTDVIHKMRSSASLAADIKESRVVLPCSSLIPTLKLSSILYKIIIMEMGMI